MDLMEKQERFAQTVELEGKANILGRRNLQSAGSSARFHGERGARAGAGRRPWTGSLCEQPGPPQCWRTRPEPKRDTNVRVGDRLVCDAFFSHLIEASICTQSSQINPQPGRMHSKALDMQ